MTKLQPNKLIATKNYKSSSSDNVYVTMLFDNCISCTCPAGGRKTLCKHLIQILDENIDKIKEIDEEFYNNILFALDLKNKNLTKTDEYKKIADKIFYVDKNIALEAYNNAKIFKDKKLEKKDIASKIFEIIDKTNIYNQFEFFDLLSKSYNNFHQTFVFKEYPIKLQEYIDLGLIIEIKKDSRIEHKKYFFEFSIEIQNCIRQLHKLLVVKFPIIYVCNDEDNFSYIEKRIIDPKYLG